MIIKLLRLIHGAFCRATVLEYVSGSFLFDF